MRLHLPIVLFATFFLNACSSLPATVAAHANLADDCAAWFLRLDAAIDAGGVRDAEAHRLPGFPYLRSNRLLASFADEAGRNSAMRVPDNYSTALRTLGLYPLVSIPFLDGVQRWQQRASGEFERRRGLPANTAGSTRHLPPALNPRTENPRSILARVGRRHFDVADLFERRFALAVE